MDANVLYIVYDALILLRKTLPRFGYQVRPPPSDSEEDEPRKRRQAPVPIVPANLEPRLSELDEELSRATSVAQLETPLFMKMYNLERTKKQTSQNTQCVTQMQASVKTEPLDVMEAAA
ncbi:hypothetical protein EVAR_4545_1 [Eumeta japonica]|uniref:Uncharacterized protein n=1 Tax=Eumeta variegata TaxID=151549 RepID=A0A4C1SVX9_EUMVA|nr:hypothetical protein EVAR_4545_1 [Eumeta japonica]